MMPIALLGFACERGEVSAALPPATAEPVVHETDLLKLTLAPEAEQRLGLETVVVKAGSVASERRTVGEIVVPPVSVGGMPTGSFANLQQIGAQHVAADGELARAEAQARLAQIATERAKGLVEDEAGSLRARDEAMAALDAANAALTVAREQRDLLGPAIASMRNSKLLWVRVSVFGSDLERVQRDSVAVVRDLGEGIATRPVHPVDGPPSANAMAGTVDLFYALPNHDRAFRVGQRVAVELPLAATDSGLVVPTAAIVRDIHGGEWVYERTAPNTYLRQRIETRSERNGATLLSRGLRDGAEVVTSGAAELFGTEFGAAR